MSSAPDLLALILGLAGIGLIPGSHIFAGIVLLFLGLGIWMADFRWQASGGGRGRLRARGSPVLLMIGLTLGAAQAYVLGADALLGAISAAVAACPADMGAAHRILLQALEALH